MGGWTSVPGTILSPDVPRAQDESKDTVFTTPYTPSLLKSLPDFTCSLSALQHHQHAPEVLMLWRMHTSINKAL